MSLRPILLDKHLARLLGSPREWGRPTLMTRGQTWHSAVNDTITCVLGPCGATETRTLKLGADVWLPVTWHRAMAAYAKANPYSAELQATLSTAISTHRRRRQILEFAGDLGRIFDEVDAGKLGGDGLSFAFGLGDLIMAWAGR